MVLKPLGRWGWMPPTGLAVKAGSRQHSAEKSQRRGWSIPGGNETHTHSSPITVTPNSPGAGVGRVATYWPWLVVNPDGSWEMEMGWVHGAMGTGPCWHPPSRQHPPSCQLSAVPAAWPGPFGVSAALGRRTRRGGSPRAHSVRDIGDEDGEDNVGTGRGDGVLLTVMPREVGASQVNPLPLLEPAGSTGRGSLPCRRMEME